MTDSEFPGVPSPTTDVATGEGVINRKRRTKARKFPIRTIEGYAMPAKDDLPIKDTLAYDHVTVQMTVDEVLSCQARTAQLSAEEMRFMLIEAHDRAVERERRALSGDEGPRRDAAMDRLTRWGVRVVPVKE